MKKTLTLFTFLLVTAHFSQLWGQNLAYQKKVFVSSTEPCCEISKEAAVDGDQITRWGSTFLDNQWIYVDLEKAFTIDKVRIIWELSRAKTYRVQISQNAKDWKDVAKVENSNLCDTIKFSPISARYLKILGHDRFDKYGISIRELEVFEKDKAFSNFEYNSRSYLKEAVVSSTEQGFGCKKEYLTDGLIETRWSSEYSDNNLAYIDLKENININRIKIYWEAPAKNFIVQVSEDGSNWKDIHDGKLEESKKITNEHRLTDIAVEPTKARYVKMLGKERNTEWGYGIWELMVFGE